MKGNFEDRAVNWWNTLSYSKVEALAQKLYSLYGSESGISSCDEKFGSGISGDPVGDFLGSDAMSINRIVVIFKRHRGLP